MHFVVVVIIVLCGHCFLLFVSMISFLYVAKYDLGKVRLKPMQSVVSPFTLRDLQGGPLEICRAVLSCCIAHIVLPADRCGSFALYFGKSLWILAPSRPSLLVAGL